MRPEPGDGQPASPRRSSRSRRSARFGNFVYARPRGALYAFSIHRASWFLDSRVAERERRDLWPAPTNSKIYRSSNTNGSVPCSVRTANGNGFTDISTLVQQVGHQVQDARAGVISSNFSTAVIPALGAATSADHNPFNDHARVAATAAEVSDASAAVNVRAAAVLGELPKRGRPNRRDPRPKVPRRYRPGAEHHQRTSGQKP